MPLNTIKEFFHKESSSGLLIMGAAVLAIISVNTFLQPLYDYLLGIPVTIRVGGLVVPAAIFIYFNYGDPQAMTGWAIPMQPI